MARRDAATSADTEQTIITVCWSEVGGGGDLEGRGEGSTRGGSKSLKDDGIWKCGNWGKGGDEERLREPWGICGVFSV